MILVVAGAFAALRIYRVGKDLSASRDLLAKVQNEIEEGQLGQARIDLAAAQSRLARANSSIYGGLDLSVVDWLPVVHQNVAVLRQSVSLAYTMVSSGSQILTSAAPLAGPDGKLELPLKQGGIPLQTSVATQQAVADLAQGLPSEVATGGLTSEALLLPQVKGLRGSIYHQAITRKAQLTNLSHGMDLVNEMIGADGPRRYLLAIANTAEERGSGGMILSFGELDSSGGRFRLGPFGSVDKVPLPGAVDNNLPADFKQRWDGYPYDSNWRQANLGADFPTVAPVLSQMYQASTGKPVDGVIQIDPSGVAALLRGTGPVDVPGLGTVSADDVVDFTLNRAYFQFPDRTQRQDALGDVARAALDRLLSGNYPSMRTLARALADSADGRHILMWSDDQATVQNLRYFDVQGALPPPRRRAFSLAVENMGGNKLDYYLDTALQLRSRPSPRGDVRPYIDATVTVHNAAPPDGTLPYVFGPAPFYPDLRRGQYHGIVSLYVPSGTELVDPRPGPDFSEPASDSEAGHQVISFEVDVDAGATVRIPLRLALLPDQRSRSVVLVPQPRVRPTKVSVDLVGSGGRPVKGRVPMTRTWLLMPGSRPVVAGGPTVATVPR